MPARVTRTYKPADILQAANHYAVTGSLSATGRQLKIPKATIHEWSKNNTEFIDHLERVRTEITTEFVGKFEAVCNKALERLSERLDDDPGSISGSQLAVISGVAIDKAQLLAGKPTSRSASVGLTELAAQFKRLSSTHHIEHDKPVPLPTP